MRETEDDVRRSVQAILMRRLGGPSELLRVLDDASSGSTDSKAMDSQTLPSTETSSSSTQAASGPPKC